MTRLGKAHKVTPFQCPTCGKELSGATQMEGNARPKVGDVGLCIYCLGWHEWVADDLARYVSMRYVVDHAEPAERRNIVFLVMATNQMHVEMIRKGELEIVDKRPRKKSA